MHDINFFQGISILIILISNIGFWFYYLKTYDTKSGDSNIGLAFIGIVLLTLSAGMISRVIL